MSRRIPTSRPCPHTPIRWQPWVSTLSGGQADDPGYDISKAVKSAVARSRLNNTWEREDPTSLCSLVAAVSTTLSPYPATPRSVRQILLPRVTPGTSDAYLDRSKTSHMFTFIGARPWKIEPSRPGSLRVRSYLGRTSLLLLSPTTTEMLARRHEPRTLYGRSKWTSRRLYSETSLAGTDSTSFDSYSSTSEFFVLRHNSAQEKDHV